MEKTENRRHFIKKLAGTALGVFGAPYIIPSSVLGLNGAVAPSDRIVMGCIGVGEMGSGHVRSLLGFNEVRIVAICDVRKAHRDRAKEWVNRRYDNNDCATYNDFRELLARPDIDAIMTATPDNWHSLIGLEAARNGKDMYYEKPLSMSIAENKAVHETVNRYGVVFQFGTQQRSDDRFRLVCELVRNGKIGELQTIMLSSPSFGPVPKQPTQPVPPDFDYDMWLGPAPWSPYTFLRCTRQWTVMRDYSLGCIGGAWGVHHVDIAQWANDADHTTPVEIEGTGFFPDGLFDTAKDFNIEYKYGNGVKLIHMDTATARKRSEKITYYEGLLFEGSEGWIFVNRRSIEAQPKSILKSGLSPNDMRLPISVDHERNFLDAVRSRTKPISSIDTALHSDIICHQGDIAIRLGRKLHWDPKKYEFVNDPEANRLLSRPMRSPWHV